MIRRLPEILSMITVCCLIGMAAGCPTSPPVNDEIKTHTSSLKNPMTTTIPHRAAVRAAQPPADGAIGCLSDDR